MDKITSLSPRANSCFETLMAQSIIATFKHQKEKKCLGYEVTKRPAFARMLFAIPQTFLPFMEWVKHEVT